MTQQRTGVSKHPTPKECLLFLNGNGDGNGDGDGNGNGYGDGDGYGYGDGYGNGYGDGNGDGYGDGDGNGYGDGDGNGYGDGDGYGYGNGYGYGDGDGNGYGNGYGNGNGNFDLKHPYYKIDGIWCKMLQIHGDYAKVEILDMYNTQNCKIAYVAKDEDVFAHGNTPKEAKKSLLYKLSDRDTSPFADWKLTDVKPKKELIRAYRAITGACEFGTRQFCESVKLPNRATVKKAIELTAGQYGNETFKQFFEGK